MLGRLHGRIAHLDIFHREAAPNQLLPPRAGPRLRLTSHTQEHGRRQCRTRRIQANAPDPAQNGVGILGVQSGSDHTLGGVGHAVLEWLGLESRDQSVAEPLPPTLLRWRTPPIHSPHYHHTPHTVIFAPSRIRSSR